MISFQQERLEKLQAIGAYLNKIASQTTDIYQDIDKSGILRFTAASARARSLNPWFTDASIHAAVEGLAYMMRPEALEEWLGRYTIESPNDRPKTVGLVMAGNIPMVGFHDLLSVYAAGHHAVVKASALDKVLMPAIIELLNEEIPGLNWDITWQEQKLGEVDAVIATGSNNTARYFEYYFSKFPHIIRKNRSSIAILTGDETEDELDALGDDIFMYFGLGCRNVSKVYMHESFDIDRLFRAIYRHNEIVNHHKYANNYDYYRALWMMNQESILDNGFMILRESEAVSSPVGTTFYERFAHLPSLRSKINTYKDDVQCVISKTDTPFGKSQKPDLWDYADGVDTMAFLTSI